MKVSKSGLELIKAHEGFVAKPYRCPAGIPTIGYGATFYPGGKKVTMKDKEITRQEGEVLLANMLTGFENAVLKLVNKPLNQNQFDAMVSFAYNLGSAALGRSTLLKKVNINPNDAGIRTEFNKWVNAGGRRLPGLVRRRKEEADLYFKKP